MSVERLRAALQFKGHRGAVLSAHALFTIGLAYLAVTSLTASEGPGNDFRYMWLAGKMWANGLSPYSGSYSHTGSTLIFDGPIPRWWDYPPNWWFVCFPLGFLSLNTARMVWIGVNITLMLAASVLLARARDLAFASLGEANSAQLLLTRTSTIAALHFFLMALLEATAIVVVVGQSSILVYFGLAGLIYGLASGNKAWTTAALALLMLKPELGLIFFVVLSFQGRRLGQSAIHAGLLSVGLAAPALVSDPFAPFAFLRNATAYDGMAIANLPEATTGLRLLAWKAFDVDIGDIGSFFVTLLAALSLTLGPLRPNSDAPPGIQGWLVTAIVAGVILALGPMHYHDFVISGVLVFWVLAAKRRFLVAAAIGLAMILRADQLGAATRLYVGILDASLLATLGALLVLPAIWSAAQMWRGPDQVRTAR